MIGAGRAVRRNRRPGIAIGSRARGRGTWGESVLSLVAQGVDRVDNRRFERGDDAEEDARPGAAARG